LDQKLDDFNRKVYSPQIEGSKTGLELPGIVDQVITMAEVKQDEGQGENSSYRAFICQTLNPFSYPAKDRSRRLNIIEEPHLGKLMTKIKSEAKSIAEHLQYSNFNNNNSNKGK
jgi:hypothetical protein